VNALRALGRVSRIARRLRLASGLVALRDVADRLLLALDRAPLSVTVEGLRLRGYLRHRSVLAHLARGDYELSVRRCFLASLNDADIVVDVGAHLGLYSLLAASRGPAARVIAVEADPYNVAALRANLRRAGADAEIVAAAASDEVGRARFHQNLGTIGSSLVARPGTGPTRPIEVDTVTLDSILGDVAGMSLLLKLDVEGAEPRALRGGEAALRTARAVTALVELNPRALAEAGSSGEELISSLRDLGLSVEILDEALDGPAAVAGPLAKGNLLCRRPSR
jgi:FkbM family methyltransferase